MRFSVGPQRSFETRLEYSYNAHTFVYYAVNIWRTIHPLTSVVPTLPKAMGGPFWFCVAAFMLLLAVLMMLRVNLGKRQAALDELYLAYED